MLNDFIIVVSYYWLGYLRVSFYWESCAALEKHFLFLLTFKFMWCWNRLMSGIICRPVSWLSWPSEKSVWTRSHMVWWVSSAFCDDCGTQVPYMLDESLSRTFFLWVFLLANLFSFNLVYQLLRVTRKCKALEHFLPMVCQIYPLDYFLPLGILGSLGDRGSVLLQFRKLSLVLWLSYRTGWNNRLGFILTLLVHSSVSLCGFPFAVVYLYSKPCWEGTFLPEVSPLPHDLSLMTSLSFLSSYVECARQHCCS